MSADCTALARSGAELLAKGGHEVGDGDADLRHGIALPDRHGLILERLEVHGDAEGRPDLVLAAIAPADRLRLVVCGHEVRANLRPHLAGEWREALVLGERQDRDLVRREMRAKAQKHACALLVGLLVVRGAEDGIGRAVRSDRCLDDVRDEPLVGDVVEVLELLPRKLGVAPQVVVGAVVDPFELVPPERERELDVGRRGRVMGALVVGVVAEAQLLPGDALLDVPQKARLLPLAVEAMGLGWAGEVLHLHLLELARPKDEVAGRDLVAKGLADLGDPKRQLPPRRLLDVLEVHEDGLRRLWPEPRDGRGVLDRTDERLEHEVELTRVGKLALAAVRAGHAREVELLRAPRGRELVALRQVVEPETLAAVPALDQRVGEILHVSRRFPHARVHEDRTVQTDDVFPQLDHRSPPGILDVALELDAERPEVPGRARAAVDLARREHEAAPLRERRDLLGDVAFSHPGCSLHETGVGCGRVLSSSRRCVVEMSRSRTYRRKPRRCRSSSAVSAESRRSRDADSRSLTKRYRSDFSPRTVSGATYGSPTAQPVQIAPPAAGSHAFVSSIKAFRHCAHSPSSGRNPERSRRWRSNHRQTVGAFIPASSARRDVSRRSKSGADGTRSAVKRSTSSATYHPAAISARSARISGWV